MHIKTKRSYQDGLLELTKLVGQKQDLGRISWSIVQTIKKNNIPIAQLIFIESNLEYPML